MQRRVVARTSTERILDDSYHVATLDNDAEAIFAELRRVRSRAQRAIGRPRSRAMRSNGLTAAAVHTGRRPRLPRGRGPPRRPERARRRGVHEASLVEQHVGLRPARVPRRGPGSAVRRRAFGRRVRDLIARRDPDLVEQNDDLTWAQLVAGFDRPLGGTIAPWPVDEDLSAADARVVDERDAPPAPTADAEPDSGDVGRRRWGDREDDARASDDEFLAVTWQSRRDDGDESRDREEHFVPDPPAPLPHLEPYKQLAWAGVVGGPLALLVAALTGLDLPEWLTWLAIVGFIGGFVTLVATMADDDDWDPDDGAVV